MTMGFMQYCMFDGDNYDDEPMDSAVRYFQIHLYSYGCGDPLGQRETT